jgi:hypothetical protein
MNEKLKELYFPLWKNYSITIRASENNDDYGFAYTTEYQEELFHSNMEKFAELIIRECIDILNPEGDLTSMREEYGRKLSMNMIKEHFGIE